MNEKLSFQDIVVLLSQKMKITQKEADRFFREVFQLILDTIYENESVKIKDLGTFKLVEVSKRESVNVNTREKIEIPAHYKMAFTPDKTLRDLVNKPFAHFESIILDDEEDFEDQEDLISNDFEEENRIQEKEEILTSQQEEKTVETEILTDPIEIDNESFNEIEEPILENDIEYKDDIDVLQIEDDEDLLKPNAGDITRNRVGTIVSEISNYINPNDVENKLLNDDWENDGYIFSELPQQMKKEQSENVNEIQNNVTKQSVTHNKQEELPYIGNLDLNANEDTIDQGQEENQYDYNDQSRKAKLKRNIPIIIIAVIVAVFVIYQYAKLFDVTYDYEYYLNSPKRLSLSDTLPMVNNNEDKTFSAITGDTVSTVRIVSTKIPDSIGVAMEKENVKPMEEKETILDNQKKSKQSDTTNSLPSIKSIKSPIANITQADAIVIGRPDGFEGLSVVPEQESAYAVVSYRVSQNLKIKVANKGQLYVGYRMFDTK